MNPELRKHLEAALQAATAAGDIDTVHSIAAVLKKSPATPPSSNTENETVTPAEHDTQTTAETVPVPPATPPTEPAEMEVEPPMGPLYTAAQTQLEALFPGHEFEDELPDAVVIAVADANGIETFYEITVTMNSDGTCALGEPVEVQPPADEPIDPNNPVDSSLPVAARHKRVIQTKGYVVDLGDKPPTEYKLWSYGTVETSKGNFLFTKEDAAAVIADIKTRGVDLHFDYEHGTFSDAAGSGQPIPAAGWYNVEARDDGLWLTNIRWTPTAAKMLEEREYRYLSPAFGVNETTNHIVSLENSALTNYPATRGIVALVEAKHNEIVTAKDLEIAKLKREKFQIEVTASMKTLTDAGVPPAVMRMVRPILEADDTATLVKTSAQNSSKPGRLMQLALLEMVKIGAVPKGEITRGNPDQSLADLEVTLSSAVDTIKKENPSIRDADAIIAARKRYPHLKAG